MNGLVEYGPRAITPSSIFFPFNRITPPMFNESTSCLAAVNWLCQFGVFDDQTGDRYLMGSRN